jgi:hypothetical protein
MTSAPTFSDETPDDSPVDWDLRVLDTPVVLDIPDTLPDQPDPLLLAAIEVLVAALLGDHAAARRIGELARSGVVALRTSAGCLEVHETLLGWTLTRTWGEPDALDLAAAARLRARRLAGERRNGCGPLE